MYGHQFSDYPLQSGAQKNDIERGKTARFEKTPYFGVFGKLTGVNVPLMLGFARHSGGFRTPKIIVTRLAPISVKSDVAPLFASIFKLSMSGYHKLAFYNYNKYTGLKQELLSRKK